MTSELPDPADAGPAYAGVRTRVTSLLTGNGHGPDVAELTVPLCPEWTVHDLVAHMSGVIEDVLSGDIAAAGTDPWTEAQVTRHRDDSLISLLSTWNELGPQVEGITSAFPPAAAAQMVFDATTHEHDLRHALDEPGARDSDGVAIGCAFLAHGFGQGIAAGKLPSLTLVLDGDRIELTGGDTSDGERPEPVVLTASRFEFLRGFGGRRSLDQLRALDWKGDPEPFLASLTGTVLRPPADPVDE
jgi:uncharacterized protein (TIGR03083 family)